MMQLAEPKIIILPSTPPRAPRQPWCTSSSSWRPRGAPFRRRRLFGGGGNRGAGNGAIHFQRALGCAAKEGARCREKLIPWTEQEMTVHGPEQLGPPISLRRSRDFPVASARRRKSSRASCPTLFWGRVRNSPKRTALAHPVSPIPEELSPMRREAMPRMSACQSR